jgi:two-component system phosphate regulon sensor histidine kinase PhoR
VVGSSSLLQQALTNLIHNAIEYSGDEPRVTIGASILESSVRITVSDNGPGIAKVHIPRLFERFYRIDPGRSRSKGGTGIGLAIVKHIAQVHRGTVDVESLPGIGSTFAITIPR